ncbi:MAG: hypothetical protein WBA97_24720 [Actinophytocola sp.]|uniref:hypothetical protein n=1 Tax=Actinophytocola sp. TaxID=1872138 RepID=UPI003C710000
MSWQEQQRLNAAAKAEQRRQDAMAAVEIERSRARARAEMEADREARAVARARQERKDRDVRRDRVAARWKARWSGLRVWAAGHVVDLLIYPLAVVSAVMAVPAMAEFGHHVYAGPAGYALPVITELGMWAFAFAVHVVRDRSARDGQDRPVWALQTGVWSFAAVAAGLNFVHGLTAAPTGPVGELIEDAAQVPRFTAGLVMAIASVAGVMAHQLVTAAPRRGRADRDTDRIARQAAAKVARIRKAAVASAVAELDDTGTARLVFRPGTYRLTRRTITPWRRGRRLTTITLPGIPATTATHNQGNEWDDLDRELAELIATTDPYPGARPGHTASAAGGGVGTLNPDHHSADDADGSRAGQRESTSIDRGVRKPGKTRKPVRKPVRRAPRSIEDLSAELAALIEADPSAVNLSSAESIRRALRCSPGRARQLRDAHHTD